MTAVGHGGDEGVKHEKSEGPTREERLSVPVNPSVRGTGKQSSRERKGFKKPSMHQEGVGHPPGGGHGGKASRTIK